MPPGDDAYRNDLAAAHSRIAALERTLATNQATSARAARITALERERVRVAEPADATDLKRATRRVGATCACVGLGFAVNHDWFFALAVGTVPLIVWQVGSAMLRASSTANAKQLALIDAELAALAREESDVAPRP